MKTLEQLQGQRTLQRKTLQELQSMTGLNASVISNSLSGKRDSRLSTIETLADALNSSLVIVPNYLLPEVQRLISGKVIGPDDVPTAAELILRGEQ